MVYAVYCRLSDAHGWSLVCPVESTDAAAAVEAGVKAWREVQGYTQVATKVVEVASVDLVQDTVEEDVA